MGEAVMNFLSGGQRGAGDILSHGAADAKNDIYHFYNEGKEMEKPYLDAGKDAIPQYQDVINSLKDMKDGKWMQNYKQSDWAKYKTHVGTESMNNAAAASGALGSGVNQQENAVLAEQIAGEDMDKWVQNQLGITDRQDRMLNNTIDRGQKSASDIAHLGGDAGQNIAALTMEQSKAEAQKVIAKYGGINNLLNSMAKGMVSSEEMALIAKLLG